MHFSDVMQTLRRDGDLWSAEVPEDWMQGRSVFGGLQAALAVAAMRALAPAGVPLRTLQASFLAPVPGGRVQLRAARMREGKSASFVEARIVDGAQTLCTAVGVFGSARPSVVAVTPPPRAVAADKPIEFRYLPGVTPAFTQFFPSRWLRGGLPFTGTPLPEAVIEVNMTDRAAAAASEAHLIAIADFLPPIALSMLAKPAAGSTMTWMLEFLADRYDQWGLAGWRVDADLVAARDGYTSQSVLVRAPDGTPAALSRQSMVVFG